MPEYRVRIKRPHAQQDRFRRSPAIRKIIKAGRRSGKTTGVAIFAIEQFLAGRRVLYATPTVDQIGRFWAEVTLALQEPIAARVYRKNETSHLIEQRFTENRIRAKTAWNSDSLRGDYADVLILDEWQLMNEDAWETVGAPMLMDNGGSALFIYTPPSLHSRSVTKATDLRHASKMFAAAQEEMKLAALEGRPSRWEAFHFTSLDNPHLSPEGLAEVTRDMTDLAYRQEILADESDETPGALWKRATLDRCRVRSAPDLDRLIIGVDPPGGATECGIVAAGTGLCLCKGIPEIHAFVVEDGSTLVGQGPEIWSREVARIYNVRLADLVVAEANYGGDMVKFTIHTADPQLNYTHVHATRGKAVRAEPVAALYESGNVHHVGPAQGFMFLEDELSNWIPGMKSPNRLDALVWALTKLMLGSSGPLREGRLVSTPRHPEMQRLGGGRRLP
jgi:hypothetical protein